MKLHGLSLCLIFMGGLALARSAPAESKTIVFFGDSLTAGYGLDDPASEAYPALIQKKIEDAGERYRVVNAGLSGETTAGGLRRIDWILRQPIDVFVLALGGNDGLRGVSPALTRANLQAIIDRVQTRYPAVKLVVAGMQMPVSMGANYGITFRAIFPEVAEKNNAILVPFLLDGVGGVTELNQADLIHPTAAGQKLLAENVWSVLKSAL